MSPRKNPSGRRSIHVMHFDRTDPHQVVAIEMKATGGRKKPRRFTRIREIRDSYRRHGYWSGRGDIVMVNVQSGEKFDQHTASPTWSGEPRGAALEWLTAEELEQARELNRKALLVAIEYPEMAFLLSGKREDGLSTREWVEKQLAERKSAVAA